MFRSLLQTRSTSAINSSYARVTSWRALSFALLGLSGVLVAVGCSSPAVRNAEGKATSAASGGSGAGGGSQINNSAGGAFVSTGAGGRMGTASGGASNANSGGATAAGGGGTVINTGWWDPAWARRRVITVQGPQAEALVNFPVPVKLGADFDFASAKSMGEDIRFTDASGTPLDSEIESWSATEAVVWVRVPSLPPMGQSVELRMYYGNPAATALPASTTQGVWSEESYIGVWHFADGKDSGAGKYDGKAMTGAGDGGMENGAGTEFVAAKVGKGLLLRQAMQSHFDLPQAAVKLGGAPAMSFSGWWQAHPSTVDSAGAIIALAGNGAIGGVPGGHAAFEIDQEGEGLYVVANPVWVKDMPFIHEFRLNNGKVVNDVWTHIVVVVDLVSSTTVVYQDGVQVEMQTGIDYMTMKFPDGLFADGGYFGCDPTVNGAFANATMDEFRLQKVNRSAEWVKAEFASMTSPTFAVVGGLETH